MKFSVSFLLLAITAASSVSAGLTKRIDNRELVIIPERTTLDELCSKWQGACIATIDILAPGSNQGVFCNQAPTAGEANVFCVTDPTTMFTDQIIGFLGLERP
ncbi:hypothetical protein C8J56DRAFT_1172613 [Mycena floridula]|nr:hypothetical protein C8J56DRAFT_1172613 [Mycena floridula]